MCRRFWWRRGFCWMKIPIRYSALIRDPIELKPLLRSFYPYLQILPGAHNLDREIREELERMLERYGTVS